MKRIILVGLLAGLAMLVVAMITNFLFVFLFPALIGEYNNPYLFVPWTELRFSLMYVYSFLLGILLAWVWYHVKGVIKAKGFVEKGIRFGVIYWIVSSIPGLVITYGTFPISLVMFSSWLVGCLVQVMCAGVIYAKLLK